MTSPSKWDAKTLIFVFAFFGVTSFGTLLSQAQRITGWLAGPAIDSAQGRALGHQDSANAIRWDSLKAWRMEDRESIRKIGAKVDTMASTLAEVPGISAAARRRRAREQAQREIVGSRGLTDDRSSFRAYKGEVIP